VLSFLLPLVVLIALVSLLAWWFWPRGTPGLDPSAAPRPVVARGDLSEAERATIELFKTASPSVVHINTVAYRRSIFSRNVQELAQGTGSGFVWDDQGHIVTNYHVIQNANGAKIILADQSSYDAQLVGGYPDKDVAVLHIDAPKNKLHPILIGTSHDLQVGQKVFAIGNPFGLDQSLTTGIISALGREIQSVNNHAIKNVIQTDAAINPGNSGGPLLDSAGRLIGVNTAIYSPSGASVGIGFAIPVDEVNQVVPQLIRQGKITRPVLGVEVAPDQIIRQLRQQGTIAERVVLVWDVRPRSPAAKAGLRPTRESSSGDIELGDIIVAFDDKPVKTIDDLYAALEAHKPGDTVTLTIVRDKQRQEVQVTLGQSS
jgi:S1-C subfamily serine protease